MSIITDALPTSFVLSGVRVPIRSDFRVWMEIEQLYHSRKVEPKERVLMSLMLCFETPEQITDWQRASDALLWFFQCGKPTDERLVKMAEARRVERLYDYEQDAPYIYAAFVEQYGIDLCEIEYMHWWKFKALFGALSDERLISKIIGYRAVNLSEVEGKARQAIAQKKALYRLNDDAAEKAEEMWRAYVEGASD